MAGKIQILILFSAFFCFTCVENRSYDIIFDRVEIINSSGIENFWNARVLRVGKFNRSAYVLNMDIELLIDFDENVSIQGDIYYSRLNNNQYSMV